MFPTGRIGPRPPRADGPPPDLIPPPGMSRRGLATQACRRRRQQVSSTNERLSRPVPNGPPDHGGHERLDQPDAGAAHEGAMPPAMECRLPTSGHRCELCRRDRIVAECERLEAAAFAYCQRRGETYWTDLLNVLGAACSHCHEHLLRTCRRRLKAFQPPLEDWEPEDVAQELLARIWPKRWLPERGPLGGWLRRIIRNLIYAALPPRHRPKVIREADLASDDDDSPLDRMYSDEAFTDPIDLAAIRERRDWLADQIALLSAVHRNVVTCRCVEGKTLKQTSEELGMSMAMVYRREIEAKRVLVDKLQQRRRREQQGGSEGGRP